MNKPSSPTFLTNIQTSQLVRWILLLGLGWAVTQVLAYFETVLIIVIFASIIAFLLDYPVSWVTRFVPRGVAAITVFMLSLLLLGGLVTTLGAVIVYQIQQLVQQSPQLIDAVIDLSERIQPLLLRWNLQVDFRSWEEQLRGWGMQLLEMNLIFIQSVLLHLVDAVLIAVIAFFMLLDGRRLWTFILKAFPPATRPDITAAVRSNFLGFFGGRLLLSTFFGVSMFMVLTILGVPFAIALAAIAGVFDLIPGIGATVGIALISVILLPQGVWVSVKVLIICIVLQQVEENLLMPRVMQGSIDMNPVVMFLALLVGARIAGFVGIFLSIPLAGMLISLFNLQDFQGQRTKPKPVRAA